MQSELLQKIEMAAAKGEPIPKDLQPPEVMLYHMLSGLYARYQCRKCSKEQAQDIKRQILGTYSRMKNEYDQFTAICRDYQERIRKSYEPKEETNILHTRAV